MNFLIFILLLYSSSIYKSQSISEEICQYVNLFRSEIGKNEIPHSNTLKYVAQIHYKNLIDNNHNPFNTTCNIHSWYRDDQLGLTDCCFPQMTNCMAGMARFLTRDWEVPYTGNVIENAHASAGSGFFGGSNPYSVVESWKNSPSHRFQMEREGWKACGAALNSTSSGSRITTIGLLWLGDADDTARQGGIVMTTPVPTPIPTPVPTPVPTTTSTIKPTITTILTTLASTTFFFSPTETKSHLKTTTDTPTTNTDIPTIISTTTTTTSSTIDITTAIPTTTNLPNNTTVLSTTTEPPTNSNISGDDLAIIVLSVFMGLFFMCLVTLSVYVLCRSKLFNRFRSHSRDDGIGLISIDSRGFWNRFEDDDGSDEDLEIGEAELSRKKQKKIDHRIHKAMKQKN